jgi:hypothetical protein
MKTQLIRMMGVVILTVTSCHAELIDRVVASVNGHVILQSDWDANVCYESFVEGRPLGDVTAAQRKASLDRLIDQELLREQIRASEATASQEEVRKRVLDIRQHYPGADNDTLWQSRLQQYGLTEKELESRIALELNVMQLVDSRLRPTIQIDNVSIESYYQQTLIPQLRQAGAKEVTLADVTPKIKELLTQQKMDQMLVAWLQNLRAESEIRTPAPPPVTGGDGPGGQKR